MGKLPPLAQPPPRLALGSIEPVRVRCLQNKIERALFREPPVLDDPQNLAGPIGFLQDDLAFVSLVIQQQIKYRNCFPEEFYVGATLTLRQHGVDLCFCLRDKI